MLIPLALMALLLHTPAPPAAVAAARAVPTVVAPAEHRAASAGARFSAALTRRLAAGWRLAAVDVIDDGSELSLDIVVAHGERAERFSLLFDGQGESALAFVRARAELPAERRVYRFAGELRTALAGGAVDGLFAECGAYFLEGAGGGASVDPYDYYVVERTARGAAARRLFARAIAGAIEDDMRVAGVIPSPGAIDVALFKGHEQVVHAELDARGRIVAVEVRWSPVAYASWARSYTGDAELARALRRARSVDALAIERGTGGAEPRLVLRLPGARSLIVDTADFKVDDEDVEDFDCPC